MASAVAAPPAALHGAVSKAPADEVTDAFLTAHDAYLARGRDAAA